MYGSLGELPNGVRGDLMAIRRMFSLEVVDTDLFLDLPLTSQALYFHFGMRADDDGFVSSPKRIIRLIGCDEDDFNILVARGYIVPFESGVIVLRHWVMQNKVQPSRKTMTQYQAELLMLCLNNGVYEVRQSAVDDVGVPSTDCQQNVNKLPVQDRLVEDRLGNIMLMAKSDKPLFAVGDIKNQPTKLILEIGKLIEAGKASSDLKPDEISKIIALFFSEYKRHIGKDHRNFSVETLINIIDAVGSCDGIGINDYESYPFNLEDYEELIPKYFKRNLDCDYSIDHFFSGDVRAYCLHELENGR